MNKNRELLLEAIEDYEKEVVLDGFTFRRPKAANILAMREVFRDTDDKINGIEHLGLVMSYCMDKADWEGLSLEQLGLIVVARGGMNGEFFMKISEVAGLDLEPANPLDSPDGSDSPSDSSDNSVVLNS